MPDFDTRQPQEPNEPNRIRTMLSANKHRILSIANKVRTLLIANRLRNLLIGGGILLFLVVTVRVGLLISSPGGIWTDNPPEDMKVPEYSVDPADDRDCSPVEGIDFEQTACYDVMTRAYDQRSLALISRDVGEYDIGNVLGQVDLHSEEGHANQYYAHVLTTPSARRAYERHHGGYDEVIEGVYIYHYA